MQNVTIQIPQPCHENWADMQPAEQGRFCASCQKTVIDYTALSDKEIIKRLSWGAETSCGRFRDEQLNRPLLSARSDNAPVWQHWVGLLTMTLFGWQTAHAQFNQSNNPVHPVSIKQANSRPEFSATTIPAKSTLNPARGWTITGRVMRVDLAGKLWPVTEAIVTVGHCTEGWHTTTDSTGAFSLCISTQQYVDELTARVSAPNRLHEQTTFRVTSSTATITLADIILHEPAPMSNVTGGGMAIIRTPSRWQKLKRKLFLTKG